MEMHEDLHPHSLLIYTLAQLPKEVGGHHPWRCSRAVEMWHSGMLVVGMVGWAGVGPGNLKGLFQP